MSATRILGVDPGSRICGYGVIDVDARGGAALVECGTIEAPSGWPMERRLGEVSRGLSEVIQELSPGVAAIEDAFVGKNPRAALALAQARGAVLAVVGLAWLSVASYAPALVKQVVSGSGRADKAQVSRMVRALLGLRGEPRADATDALAVALAHARHVSRARQIS